MEFPHNLKHSLVKNHFDLSTNTQAAHFISYFALACHPTSDLRMGDNEDPRLTHPEESEDTRRWSRASSIIQRGPNTLYFFNKNDLAVRALLSVNKLR